MAAVLTPGITPLWSATVEQYHAMIANGILDEDDRVELLEGVIVEKMPKNAPHSTATWNTREILRALAPRGWYVDSQEPITLHDSEPEPDVILIRGNRSDYSTGHPGPRDIGLVVEISDSSLDRDRILKKRIYARAGVPFYWVLNLSKTRLEVYSDPRDGDYSQTAMYEHSRMCR